MVALTMCAGAQDAAEIVRRSIMTDQGSIAKLKDYAFSETHVERDLDAAGRAVTTETKTYDTIVLYGRPFRKLVAKNGAPLAASAAAKEDARLRKAIDERRGQANSDKEEERARKEREEIRKVASELPKSHTLTLLGTEMVSGRPVWVVRADPKPSYRPINREAGIMWRMSAKLWIDQSDYHWAKLEADVLDTISFGLVIARLSPGTRIEMEQARVNDQVWAMSHFRIKIDGRLGLVKKIRQELEISYRDYRKFQTDSRVVVIGSDQK